MRRRVPDAEQQWLRVLGTLNELQARVCVAQRVVELGRGGISRLSRLTGMSRPTIMKGIAELTSRASLPRADTGRVRHPGGDRKRCRGIVSRVDASLGPDRRGADRAAIR